MTSTTGRPAQLFARKITSKGVPVLVSLGFGETGRGCSSITALLLMQVLSYEDVKMVVDVLQRAVLGKAREIHYLPLMSSRSADSYS